MNLTLYSSNVRCIQRTDYIVAFDWDNREVAVAQGANCGAPDLFPIGKGPNAIPSVTGNCKSA